MKNLLASEQAKLSSTTVKNATDVKLLGNGENTSEEIKMIQQLCGSDSPVVVAQKEMGEDIELAKHNKAYAGDVYSIESIESLALKYNLRFRGSQNYKGMLGFDVIKAIKRFADMTNTNISEMNLSRKFWIMTSQKSMTGKGSSVVMLFYQVDNKCFRLVHTFGELPVYTGLVTGFMFRSLKNLAISNGAILTSLTTFLFCYFNTYAEIIQHYPILIFLQILSFFIPFAVTFLSYSDSELKRQRTFTTESLENNRYTNW